MPRSPEQYEEIREERRKLIMETALELFATRGYHGTSINDISRKAGISKGLLYNYFSGKEKLVIDIMKKGFYDLIVLFDPDHDGNLTKAKMKYFVTEVMNMVIKNVRFWRLYFAVISQPIVNQVAFGEIMEIAMPVYDVLSDYFRRMGYENPEAEARMFTAMMDGFTLNYVYDPKNFPVETVINRISEIYNLDDK